MPTSTTNYSYNKPLVNDATDEDLWGGYLNENFDDIDTHMKRATDFVTVSVSSTHSGSSSDRNKALLCDASGGAFNVNLVAAATAGSGFTLMIKKIDSSANAVTIDGDGSDMIDGDLTYSLGTQDAFVILVSDGSDWHIFSGASVSASESQAGSIEIATASEILAGLSNVLAMTPGRFAGNKSLAANGYYKLPGGLILQWGSETSIALPGSRAVSFPTAFASAVYGVYTVPSLNANLGEDSNAATYPQTSSVGLSGFTILADDVGVSSTINCYWFAIGV